MIRITSSYDNINERQLAEEKRLKAVDAVYAQIESYKRVIADSVNREIANQVVLAAAEARGFDIDPESQMSGDEITMMVAEAALLMDQLEMQEESILQFKMARRTKKFKC